MVKKQLLALVLLSPFLMAASCATMMMKGGALMNEVGRAAVNIGNTLAHEPTKQEQRQFDAMFQGKIEKSKALWMDDFRAWNVPAPPDYYNVPYAPYRSHPMNCQR